MKIPETCPSGICKSLSFVFVDKLAFIGIRFIDTFSQHHTGVSISVDRHKRDDQPEREEKLRSKKKRKTRVSSETSDSVFVKTFPYTG